MSYEKIRPLSKADLDKFGVTNEGYTMRGWVAVIDDEPVGIACILYSKPLQLVSVITDELRNNPRFIIKCARVMTKVLNSTLSSVYSVADPTVEASGRFLEHIGFDYVVDTADGPLYLWSK